MDLYLLHYHGSGSLSPSYKSTYESSRSGSRGASLYQSSSTTSRSTSRPRARSATATYVPGQYSSSGYRRYSLPHQYQGPTTISVTPRYKPHYSSTPGISHGPARVFVVQSQVGEPIPVMADEHTEMAYNPRRSGSSRPAYDNYAEDEVYLEKMQDILSAYPCVGVPPEPSPILGSVYIGTTANAENFRILKQHKISYILNCAGGNPMEFRRLRELYAPEHTGVNGYEELPLEDRETENIRDYLGRAHKFIDFARSRNGRVLIACPGVSRSGAVAISYLIANGSPLLEAVRAVKSQRRLVLCNVGFMRQLVRYARGRGMLDSGVSAVSKERSQTMRDLLSSNTYSTKFDRHRYYTASMPRIIKKAY